MRSPKISIIIPVFNTERFLPDCIDSVLNQSFTDFEIILINDGSSDRSGEILDEYLGKDFRITVYHKNNEGVSSARNFGIENSKSDWICFVDSDDFILENYLSDLFNSAIGEIDLVIQGFKRTENGKELCFDLGSFELERDRIDYQELFEKLKIVDFGFSCAKLYRREIIVKNKILFPLETSHAEDLVFLLRYLPFARKSISMPIHNYLYRYNEMSLARTFQKPSVYYYQYFFLKDTLKRNFPEVFLDAFHENSKKFRYSQYNLFSTLLKFIKAMYFYKFEKKERISWFQKFDNYDFSLLGFLGRGVKNPFLNITFTYLIQTHIQLADFLLFNYYIVVNKFRKRNAKL